MKITVCVPAYNESPIIERTLKTINRFCETERKHEWKIVVADNGSTDGTAEIATRVPKVSVIRVNGRGKGLAVATAARQDDGDIFCFIDADLSAAPSSLTELISAIEGGADIAIGSRLLDTAKLQRSFIRTLSSRLFNFFRRFILGIKVSDSQCGLKAMNKRGRAILASASEPGWFFDMELLTKAERAGLLVSEIAVPWQETVYPERESQLRIFRDGCQGLLAMFRIRKNVSSPKELDKTAIISLVALAAIAYLSFFAWHTWVVQINNAQSDSVYFERGDATGYVDMAESILRNDPSLLADDDFTRSLRTPGYPIFLAGIFSLAKEPLVVIILQILIALATIPFLYKIGQKLTNSTTAFLATTAYILYPTTAFLNTQILVETIFMFLTTVALWLLLVFSSPSYWRYFFIGLTSGIATLVRPTFLYIVPLIIIYILLQKNNLWKKLITAGLILIGFFLMLAPWLHANQRDFGEASLSTAGNYNILYVYIPQFLAQHEEAEGGWITLAKSFAEETREAGYIPGTHQASDFESNQIKEKLAENEVDYALFHIQRSILTFVTSGLKMVNNEMTELGRPLFSTTPWLIQHVYTYGLSWDLLKSNSLAFLDAGISALLTLLLPVVIIVALWRRDKQILGLLLIFAMIVVTALLAGPNGNARYRMPIQPYIFLLAFTSLFIIYQYFKTVLVLKIKTPKREQI